MSHHQDIRIVVSKRDFTKRSFPEIYQSLIQREVREALNGNVGKNMSSIIWVLNYLWKYLT